MLRGSLNRFTSLRVAGVIPPFELFYQLKSHWRQRGDCTRYVFECSSWNNSILITKTTLSSRNQRADAFSDWLLTNHASSVCFGINSKSTKIDFPKKPWVPAREMIRSHFVMQKRNSPHCSCQRCAWQTESGFRGQNHRCREIAIISWLQKDQNWFWDKTIFSGKRFSRVWLQNGSTTPQMIWARRGAWQTESGFYSDAFWAMLSIVYRQQNIWCETVYFLAHSICTMWLLTHNSPSGHLALQV